MGRDKALLLIDGRPMALRVADALRGSGCAEVTAIGGDLEALAAVGLPVHPDDHPGDGPLPATITALQAARSPLVLVMSCDLVAPSSSAMRDTLDVLRATPDADVAVPVSDGHRQWTHAAWRREAWSVLQERYSAGDRSLRRAAGALVVVEVTTLDAEALADADVPGELPPAR
jgi:molybdopterin-guanine dinucleotide biosynthesis protein A